MRSDDIDIDADTTRGELVEHDAGTPMDDDETMSIDDAATAEPHTRGASASLSDHDLDDRPYRSISEVADMIGVKPHVLRYWETQFGGLRPKKNRAGNRMYRPDEIRTLIQIKELLYARRFTIEGAKKKLGEQRKVEPPPEPKFGDAVSKLLLHEVKSELRKLATELRRGPTG